MNTSAASRILAAVLALAAHGALAHPGHGAIGLTHHIEDIVPMLAAIAAVVAIATAVALVRRLASGAKARGPQSGERP